MSASVTSKRVGVIEKGLPIPASDPKRGRKAKYPWLTMEVGDSFLMPHSRAGDNFANARSCISNAQRRYGMQFRKKLDRGGIRIWRTA